MADWLAQFDDEVSTMLGGKPRKQAEARSYEPTLRDRIAGYLMGDERASTYKARFVEGLLGSRGMGTTGAGLADVTPLGIPMGIQDAMRGDEPARDSLLAIFGGPMARTADRTALAAAQKLKAAGAPREKIWKETGWFEGVDGKWRFEIDDSSSTARQTTATGLRLPGLADGLTHGALFAAYPDAAKFPASLRIAEGARKGGFTTTGLPMITADAPNAQDLKSVALHEAQHLLQSTEGFARGSSPLVVTRADIAAERNRLASIPDRDAWTSVNTAPGDLSDDAIAMKLYQRAAGEAEARLVQKRMNMTPDQRRDRAPWLDYDVPEDQQIVRFTGGDVANSVESQKIAKEAAGEVKQGIRAAGEGSRNYVVFDDKLIDIVKKYGIAATAAALGMSQAEFKAQFERSQQK